MSEETKVTSEDKEKRKKSIPQEQNDLPNKPLNTAATVLILAYLILFSVLLLYSLIQLWPISDSANSTDTSPSNTNYLFWSLSISNEVRMLLIVMLAGAIGGLVHALRSVYWYVGHRSLVKSWLGMYILLPFVGATLGIIFYLAIRGGFFSPQATTEQTSPYGFTALACLVGMFSEQAVLKLKQVFEILLTKAPKGENANPQENE